MFVVGQWSQEIEIPQGRVSTCSGDESHSSYSSIKTFEGISLNFKKKFKKETIFEKGLEA